MALLLHAVTGVWAHEDTQTHSRLTVGAILFLQQTFPEDAAVFSQQARQFMVDGSIHEDDNPNYLHHFFNPKTGRALSIFVDTAPKRASDFWTSARQSYQSGNHDAAASDLGHVLHLLQDMTSPAHVHLDQHGQIRLGHCEGDGDDFEIWGYCDNVGINAILQYVTSTNIQTSIIRPALSNGLQKIFRNLPQRPLAIGGDINPGYTFVRSLANAVYDFTTFPVTLRDTFNANDPGGGELKAMFPSLEETTVPPAWWIGEIGYSEGECVYTSPPTFNESWWIMPGCSQRYENLGTVYVVEGQAYIENTGGGSGSTLAIPETLIPARYNRPWFNLRYGSIVNSNRTSMLRIYGDVLYPAAVAYGAGLLQAFLDSAIMLKPVSARPSEIAVSSAQLNGQVRPNGETAWAWFEWGTGSSLGNLTAIQGVGAGSALTNVSLAITGLAPDTVYSCRIVSSNRFGVRYGIRQTFRTPVQLLVTSNAPNAWQITDISISTTLNYTTNLLPSHQQAAINNGWRYTITSRMVDDFGGTKTMTFLYQASATRRFLVWWDLDGNGNLTAEMEGQPVRVVATNGFGSTLYHTHELRYTNGTATYLFDGTIVGAWTGVALSLQPAGQVYWGGGSGAGTAQMNFRDVVFEITDVGVVAAYHAGTTGAMATAPNPATQGWTATPAAPQAPNAFTPVASDSEPYEMHVQTVAASDIRPDSARLNGRLDPRDQAAVGWFEWGTSASYGNTTSARAMGSGFGWRDASEDLAGLTPEQTYHFRFVASNAAVVVFGADQVFDTERPVVIISSGVPLPGQFRLEFVGTPGRTYEVLRSSDLIAWQPIGEGIEISPGFFEFLDTPSPVAGAFYRVLSGPAQP